MKRLNSNILTVGITILLIVVVLVSSLVTSHIVEQFEEETGLKVLVTCGNHDINRPDKATTYENGYEEKTEKLLPQTLIRVGRVVFAPFPFEMFGEIGLRIDGAVNDLKVLTLSYTNGQLLYLPTEDQLCRGGHEVNLFRYSNVQQYADNTDYHLVLGTLENLEKLER